MKNLRLIICAALLILSAACIREPGENTPRPADKVNPFSFATSSEIGLTLAYEATHNTRVEIYTQNPLTVDTYKNYVKDAALRPVASGYTDSEGRLNASLRLPASAEELFVYSPSAAAPVLLGGRISEGRISLSEKDAVAPRNAVRSRGIADTDVYWTNWAKQSFSFRPNPAWSWDAQGRPSYLLPEPMPMDADLLNTIDNTIPKDEALELIFAQLEHIAISENANVSLYYVSDGSARRNTLAYYTYTDNEPTQAAINRTLTVLYPNLSAEALKPGEGVRLAYYDGETWSDVFPAGSKIGFVLLPDAWNGNGIDATNCHAVYSRKKYNNYNIPSDNVFLGDRPHMACFDANGHFVLSFEDLPYSERKQSDHKGDFSDNVFVLTANPVTALPEVRPGIDDETLPSYTFTSEAYGILAFEDNWPYKGDYDLNDAVVKYASKLYFDFEEMAYVMLEDEFTFLNAGGKYRDGFGIEYGFPTSDLDLQKTRITATTPDGAELGVPGFDPDLQTATLMLFDNASDGSVPAGTRFSVRIVFRKGGVSSLGFMLPPYNPFLTVNDEGGLRKEVHLVDHRPTPKADPQFFGYGHDLSGNGRYYVSDAAYPFALDLSSVETFRLPDEMQCIGEAYPRFDSWAASGGTRDKDWYRD